MAEQGRGEIGARLIELAAEVGSGALVGVDAVHIPSWKRHLELGGGGLQRRIYTEAELAFCDRRVERLSTRFAAKEAVLKVLGTGVRGVGMREIEVVSEPSGRPTVHLHDRAEEIAETLGLGDFELSLCHEVDYALALASASRGK